MNKKALNNKYKEINIFTRWFTGLAEKEAEGGANNCYYPPTPTVSFDFCSTRARAELTPWNRDLFCQVSGATSHHASSCHLLLRFVRVLQVVRDQLPIGPTRVCMQEEVSEKTGFRIGCGARETETWCPRYLPRVPEFECVRNARLNFGILMLHPFQFFSSAVGTKKRIFLCAFSRLA